MRFLQRDGARAKVQDRLDGIAKEIRMKIDFLTVLNGADAVCACAHVCMCVCVRNTRVVVCSVVISGS